MELKSIETKDLDEIYDFFIKNKWKIVCSRLYWKQILKKKWSSKIFKGSILKKDSKIIGVLIVISSDQIVNNKKVTFCNFNTWFVIKEYRNYSIRLFDSVSKQKNVFITTATVTSDLIEFHKRFNFTYIDKIFRYSFINSFKVFSNTQNKINIKIFKNKNQLNILDEFHKKIFNDHIDIYNLKFINFESQNKNLFVVYKKNFKKKLFPFAEILYISDYNLFFKFINKIKIYFLIKDFCIYHTVFIDENFFKPLNFLKKNKFNLMIKNNTKEKISFNLNFLYSEFLLM